MFFFSGFSLLCHATYSVCPGALSLSLQGITMHDFQFFDREAVEGLQAKEHQYADRRNAIISELKARALLFEWSLENSYTLQLYWASVLYFSLKTVGDI